jgi:hypothetical protein
MFNPFDYPMLVFGGSFVALSLVARIGWSFKSVRALQTEARGDFDLILGATLTLLGLLIGFSFSMAIARYDLRKNYEEAEANAIGTEFVRASLLPPTDATSVRALLSKYLDQRVLFYLTHDQRQLREINTHTAQLQNELWSAVQTPATAQPSSVIALTLSGMNDVLNSQSYTQAAWRNRIPRAAWSLMTLIAICCNLMVGYGSQISKGGRVLRMILPLVLSIAFLLIADIDSPRGGLVHVYPQNLLSLSASLAGN